MQAIKKPYEILVRYDSDGNLKGAHVAWTHIVTLDDGTIIRKQTNPEPVDVGQGAGFPIDDLINEVAAGALAAKEAAETERDAAVAEKNALAAQLEAQDA